MLEANRSSAEPSGATNAADAAQTETVLSLPPAPADRTAAELTSSTTPATDPAPQPVGRGSKQAFLQASKQARKHASVQEREQASKRADGATHQGEPRPSLQESVGREILGGTPLVPADVISDEVWASLDVQATITNAFRYTDDELSALADALYQISKEQRARVTKQDAARLGLNLVLEDYRRRGPESLLGQLASRRKQPRRASGG